MRFEGMLFFRDGTGGWWLSRCLIRGGFTWRPGRVWQGHSLSLMFHSDLISSIFSAPAWWICRENTGIDLWNDNLAQSGKCSKTKTPTLTEPGWHAGQRAYRMKRRREGNMEKKKTFQGKETGSQQTYRLIPSISRMKLKPVRKDQRGASERGTAKWISSVHRQPESG